MLHRFLQEAVKLLEPIEVVTRHLCGANYPTLNLVHPYMESLKKKFSPRADKNETLDLYLNLIYGDTSRNNPIRPIFKLPKVDRKLVKCLPIISKKIGKFDIAEFYIPPATCQKFDI